MKKEGSSTTSEKKKQTIVIVVSRYEIQLGLITPLSLILPSISLLYPVRLYTSRNIEIHSFKHLNLFQALVKHLQTKLQEGQCNINQTLKTVLKDNEKNFRVCVIGNENIDWSIVMEYKRKSIIIDTIGSNQQLLQISYVTGGISKNVSETQMMKTFLETFSLGTKTRKLFKSEQKKQIEFSLKCTCCNQYLKADFRACSVCLSAYGHKQRLRDQEFECKGCGFYNNQVTHH